MYKQNRFTPIEDVMNIFDQNRLWLYIPGFNGYEVSTDGYIRSMKHYRKHLYGILIKPKEQDSSDPVYELSDNNNKRQRIHYSQIAMLANQNPYEVASYPRHTMLANTASRNKFVKNDSGAYVKVYNGRKRTSINGLPDDKTTHYAKFTVVQTGTETLGMQFKQPEIKCAFRPIDPNSVEFYGISNCRILVSGQGE